MELASSIESSNDFNDTKAGDLESTIHGYVMLESFIIISHICQMLS